MKFNTTKNNLIKALLENSKVVPTRTTLPILSCVLIEAKNNKLTTKTTNLEQTMIVEVEGKIINEGSAAIPIGKFIEIVSALKETTVEVETKEQEKEINSDNGIYKITGKDVAEYPDLPQTKPLQTLSFSNEEFLSIIKSTTYAVSKDDIKPALCGVYLKVENQEATAVATDGHRLVKYNTKLKAKQETTTSIIVPAKFFNITKTKLEGEGEVKINISENHLDVEQNNNKLITRIIKESFPDFNSVIPEELNIKAKINTEKTIKGIKRVAIFSNKTTKQVFMEFDKNELTISTEDKETRSSAKEHLECEYNNEKITIAYNAQYLKEVIQHIDSQEVEVFLSGPLTAAVFKPKNQQETTTLTALLMPLRTKN